MSDHTCPIVCDPIGYYYIGSNSVIALRIKDRERDLVAHHYHPSNNKKRRGSDKTFQRSMSLSTMIQLTDISEIKLEAQTVLSSSRFNLCFLINESIINNESLFEHGRAFIVALN